MTSRESERKGSTVRNQEYQRVYTLWVTLPHYVAIVYPWFVPAHMDGGESK